MMELSSASTVKKKRQLAIFNAYATPLRQDERRLRASYEHGGVVGGHVASNEKVLLFDDFVDLISNSRSFYSKFTDHCFNLNQIPNTVFGCIFFAIDENNKGYLNVNDWFYFNNVLEYDNYHFIILYEFFRKFDAARERAYGPSVKSINYGNRFLSFDELYLDLEQFQATLRLLHSCVRDDFIVNNKLFLDWKQFRWLKWYQFYPRGLLQNGPHITLNSLISIVQNDLKSEKLLLGFHCLSQLDHRTNSMTISKNQLVYLMRLFYSHKIPADIFNSLNMSTLSCAKCDNNHINYNVFRDLFYLIQNFDLLNQIVHRYAEVHKFSDRDVREQHISRKDLLRFMNTEYNKINNIIEFSPAQISLLFSIVTNSKKLNYLNNARQNNPELSYHHRDSEIDSFIHNEYINGNAASSLHNESLEKFNDDFENIIQADAGDTKQQISSTDWRSVFSWSSFLSSFEWLHFKKRKSVQTNGLSDEYVNEALTLEDIMKIVNPNYLNDLVHHMELRRIESESRSSNLYFYPIFDSIYNFTLGSVAGCIGAMVVYPIDMVKTRMQAQRDFSKYKNSIDCLLKILSKEGVRGLYSGLGPQLIGVAPEKAIKLTVNDHMRATLAGRDGKLSLPCEIISGATAGACQVVFTNPLEIVKIRLQVKSDYVADAARNSVNAISVIKNLGLIGLYRGAGACLLRDIPFSAIYFPTYAHIKSNVFNFDPKDSDKRNKLNTWQLLVSGGLAGMPAAFLTTPFDVIKTRLQIDPKKGESVYNGIWDAARTILKEEGIKSFFKGGPARVLRSSPQFGFTLAAYEIFHNLFPAPRYDDSTTHRPTREPVGALAPINKTVSAFFPDQLEPHVGNNKWASRLYGPNIDPYSSSFLNYYYKSCQVAKAFMDLDYNFAHFDFNTYQQFHDELNAMKNKKH
ncbi:ADL049Wp [Eremothecium gossypii ATCC 10895]|nr:ADL049Wp [Eremothecium gossypii ATCC 10895]AAS51871.1 ADL049Wp [Eremothecium gossypii ATCC 10895]AEY96169.1 FADL049Wp [Eremothecium gossypii FDAG1]